MLQYEREVFLANTDATGVVYFANYFAFASEGLERLLKKEKISLSKEIFHGGYGFPVVHAEASYLAPLILGDLCQIKVVIEKIGDSSVTFKVEISKEEKIVSVVTLIHAWISKKTGKKESLPDQVRKLLKKYVVES